MKEAPSNSISAPSESPEERKRRLARERQRRHREKLRAKQRLSAPASDSTPVPAPPDSSTSSRRFNPPPLAHLHHQPSSSTPRQSSPPPITRRLHPVRPSPLHAPPAHHSTIRPPVKPVTLHKNPVHRPLSDPPKPFRATSRHGQQQHPSAFTAKQSNRMDTQDHSSPSQLPHHQQQHQQDHHPSHHPPQPSQQHQQVQPPTQQPQTQLQPRSQPQSHTPSQLQPQPQPQPQPQHQHQPQPQPQPQQPQDQQKHNQHPLPLQPQDHRKQELQYSHHAPLQSHLSQMQHSQLAPTPNPIPSSHNLLPQQHHHLSQHAPAHQLHRVQDSHHPYAAEQQHPTPKTQTLPPASLSERIKSAHRPQLHRPYDPSLLLHQPAPTFTHQNHAFSNANVPPHQSQPQQAPPDHQFGFPPSSTDPTFQQHSYGPETQRSYLNEIPPREHPHYSRYQAPPIRHASTHPDPTPALTAIASSAMPTTMNGIHVSLPPSANANVPPPSSQFPQSFNRDAPSNRYAQMQVSPQHALNQPLQQPQVPAVQIVSNKDSNTEQGQDHDPNETAEERKRRLARERQRRRRKRLKLDPQGLGNKTPIGTPSHPVDDDSQRDTSGPTQNAQVDMNIHIRTTADNPVHIQTTAIQHGLQPPFESSNLAGTHHTSFTPNAATQDDIPVPSATGRGPYNLQSINVGSATPPSGSVALTSSHRAAAELARLSLPYEDRVVRTPDPNEDPEARKRRLARDRQRRRRMRLRSKKMEEDAEEKAQVNQSQSLKFSGVSAQSKGEPMDGTRTQSELDRRGVPPENIAESVRMPLGTATSGVFGTRTDVAPSLSFEQNRGVRNGNAPNTGFQEVVPAGMTINFGTNAALNMSGLPVYGLVSTQNLMHWSQAFESESAARLAVESAAGAFRAQLANSNPNARMYVVQHAIALIAGSDDVSREGVNGQMLSSLRADGVMRIP